MLSLLKHELLSRWGAVLGWGLGIGAFGSMYISIFPQVAEEMQSLSDLQIYAAMGIELGSFEGFIASSAVQFIPILLGIYAIITSSSTLVGEEEDGTLELIAAMPISRWQIVLVKAVALSIIMALILLIAGILDVIALNAVASTTEVDVTLEQMFGVVLNAWPISFAFAMMGLFLGGWLPTRRAASLTLTAIFVASYFAETLPGMVPELDFIEPFSLFTYFDSSSNVFIEGVQAGDVLTLIGVGVAFLILAVLSFQRRNLTVHTWPWQRPQPEA